MAKSTAQKEAADIWRREQQEEEWAEGSRLKARYLVRYLSDVGDTKNAEAESKLNEIRKLADKSGMQVQRLCASSEKNADSVQCACNPCNARVQ